MAKKLILASASPRRSELLTMAGYSFSVIPSNADEVSGGLDPKELVRQNALVKAREVFSRCQDSVVLGADTIVCFDGKILGKPTDEEDAFKMLKSLSKSRHSVLTGFAVISENGEESGVCETFVKFKELSDSEILDYIATSEPLDKAGAYGIQERASLFADFVEGDFFNIIGLPVGKIYPVLKKNDVFPSWMRSFN